MKSNSAALVILLNTKLKVGFAPPRETGDIIFDGIRLIDQGLGGFMGFHDWLRKQGLPNQILGVRFWPHESFYLPAEALKDRDYISIPPSQKQVQVWFGPSRNFEEEISGDQCLGLNRVLVSADQAHVALVLDLNGLTPDELMNVQSALNVKLVAWA